MMFFKLVTTLLTTLDGKNGNLEFPSLLLLNTSRAILPTPPVEKWRNLLIMDRYLLEL